MNTTHLALAALLLAAACRDNPYFCEDAPDHNCNERDGGPPACTTSAQCTAPTPVCDVGGTATCVACTPDQSDACTGAAPICSDDLTCRGCAAHAECASAACLPDGACADPAEVAYVDPAGAAAAPCTAAAPCRQLATALATARPYVKLRGTTDEAVVIADRDVTLLAEPGARLTRTTNGIVLEIRGTSRVAIHGLEIRGGSGGDGGIGLYLPAGGTQRVTLVGAAVRDNTGIGVVASGGRLIARRSRFLGNAGGGLSLQATQFDLENNVIAKNGGLASAFGGVLLSQLGSGTRRFDFNTVAANAAEAGATTGVLCSVITQPITFSSNIVYGNNAIGGGGTQIGGANCAWAYSDIGPGDPGGAGGTNLDADPRFVSIMLGDFHISAGSPVIDRADPGAALDVDLDGEPRPQGGARDIGADERAP